jgi:plastocyanin
MISFGGTTGLKYSPACIKINKGSSLTFNGSFSSHPLSGGLDGSADASSPITHTTTGSTATFPFPNAGTFGFYCDFHFGSGMEGAVFVQ